MSTKKLTNAIVDIKLKGRNIKRVSEYKNAHTSIEFQCLNVDCNHIWKAKPHNLIGINQSGCPMCSKFSRPVNIENLDDTLIKRNIKRVDNYKGMNKKIQFECLLDGHKWMSKPGDIIHAEQGCRKCSIREKHRTNEYVDEFIKNKPFIRVSDYIDTFTKVNWKCKVDGNIWSTTFTEIRRGSGCPQCKNKKESHIKDIIQHKFKIYDIKPHHFINGKNRRYNVDFYFERNGHKIAIEYDGEQHYTPVKFGGISQEEADQNFKEQTIRDKELKDLCANEKINLLNIPYWFTDDQIILSLSEYLHYFI